MLPEQARVQDTRDWLEFARRDLRAAEHDLKDGPELNRDVMFHCQQAVEKAFKAFLTWHDIPFRRTHELETLGAQCAEIDASLWTLIEKVSDLTKYAWRLRYPGAPYEPGVEEIQRALASARETFEGILDRLPEEARP